ncbi:MAG: efflux RND transporter periplasmic adaptor subunit [Candidatus Acidiferrum sp.]
MPSADQDAILDTSALSTSLLAEREVAPRARALAKFVAGLLGDAAVSVYTLASDSTATYWIPKATLGEVAIHEESIAAGGGILGRLLDEQEPVLRNAADLRREDYPHIDTRKTFLSLCYIPLFHNENLLGALEIFSFEEELAPEAAEALLPACGVAAAAIESAQTFETERNDTLRSITRLTQLYDLEKVFSSTLEMTELLPLMAEKFVEILECEGVNIWLLHPNETLELMHQAGQDPTVFKGQIVKPAEGIAGVLSDTGESLCIADESDPRLVERNEASDGAHVASLMAVPIMDRGALVGVVEAINRLDGVPFDEDDLFNLSSLSDTASTALHNASLFMAERKVEILETLNTVSHEITSTLNLERMLQTIVNAPQAVIPYERAGIALEQRGKFKLSAVTGLTQVNTDAPDVAPLNEIMQWAALSEEVIHVRQHDEEIESDREETRAKFRKYFAESGMRGFYARPLSDDTGRVGTYAMEASDPDFLGPAHIEILEVLAGQATVALRNAQMYKEVPFISVIEPVLVRKRKFMAMEKRRRAMWVLAGLVALFFLVACPLPFRVAGDAIVAPGRRALVQPEVEGVVGKVQVHEGEKVRRGQVLAEMEAWNLRSAVAEARAKYESSMMQMNRALAANDGSEAGIHRVQADYWEAEVDRAGQSLEKAQLRSPIDGVVATAHVENFTGRKLQQGETFAEVVDTSEATVDVAVSDSEAALLKSGQKAVIKLNSYPTRTFSGEVTVVSPKAEIVHETPVFYARVGLANADGAIRTGMEGRGKVRIGWYPAAYVFFREPFLWAYSKVWYWLGW